MFIDLFTWPGYSIVDKTKINIYGLLGIIMQICYEIFIFVNCSLIRQILYLICMLNVNAASFDFQLKVLTNKVPLEVFRNSGYSDSQNDQCAAEANAFTSNNNHLEKVGYFLQS